MSNLSLVLHECQFKCDYLKHSSNLTAALTKDSLSDKKLASYLKWCCVKYIKAVDENGRTLLHMAAAKGRTKLLRFLLKHKSIIIDQPDMESRFTALHCSLFYGHIGCAVELIKAGANTEQIDMDELSPLDHITADKPLNVRDLDAGAHDVFVWGANTNNTLGFGHRQMKDHPEALELFRKQKVFFKQVVLGRYHSAFLARDGRLWMCGDGTGGRLGLEKEASLNLPKQMNLTTTTPECYAVALGIDHTIVVMADKTVWSFGLNTYHQLGHDPPSEKVLMPKFIRGLRHVGIMGVSASKFHSAFWSETRLYTCGLNGGQLGHTKESGRTVIVPKAVSGLRQCGIKAVTCTNGSTILANNYGEIYLFYDYICRKITSRPFYPKLLCALGGRLDARVDREHLVENGGSELQVLVVTTCNCIYIWRESDRRYLKYDFHFERRTVGIHNITFHDTFVILTSRDGKAYYGDVYGKRMGSTGATGTAGPRSNKLGPKNYIQLTRIPYMHRAVLVNSDPDGKNFAITQFQPKSRLYNFPRVTHSEVDEHMRNLFKALERFNYFQDVEFEVQGRLFSAHRYIVGHASKVLEDMMNNKVRPDGTCRVKIENVGVQVFRALLCFIYTRDFNLVCPLTHGCRSIDCRKNAGVNPKEWKIDCRRRTYHHVDDKPMTGKEKALFMRLLLKAANMFGVKSLKEEFEGEDMLFKRTRSFPNSLVKFDRERLSYLWDITLRSEDGMEIPAHKCILVSRLEYFNCMMNNKIWIESSQHSAITLPIPGTVLTILIDYLYTGAAPSILKSTDLDLVFMTLVTADQFFCNGLKNICEYTLSQILDLDNASDILQIGLTFNAADLKRFALEFICQNLAYLLETKAFEHLPDCVLAELSEYYRSRVPQMCMRHITAFLNAPDEALVDLIHKTEPVSLHKLEEKPETRSGSSTPVRGGGRFRKSRRLSRSLDSLLVEETEETLGVLLETTTREVKRRDAPWIKVAKRPTGEQSNSEGNVNSLDEVSIKATNQVGGDKYERVRIIPLKAISMNSLEDIQCPRTTSERDFPALKPSSSERTLDSYPPSLRLNCPVSEKIFRFTPMHLRKRKSISKKEEIQNQSETAASAPVANCAPTTKLSTVPVRVSNGIPFRKTSYLSGRRGGSVRRLVTTPRPRTCISRGCLVASFPNKIIIPRSSSDVSDSDSADGIYSSDGDPAQNARHRGRRAESGFKRRSDRSFRSLEERTLYESKTIKIKCMEVNALQEQAIDDLKVFYNADIVKGERITVRAIKRDEF